MFSLHIIRGTTFPSKLHVRPVKTQISLLIHAVWSESFDVRAKTNWILCYQHSALWSFWSDCADVEADLRLRWAYKQLCRKCCTSVHSYLIMVNLWFFFNFCTMSKLAVCLSRRSSHWDTGDRRFFFFCCCFFFRLNRNIRYTTFRIVVWLTREESNIITERYHDLLCTPILTNVSYQNTYTRLFPGHPRFPTWNAKSP